MSIRRGWMGAGGLIALISLLGPVVEPASGQCGYEWTSGGALPGLDGHVDATAIFDDGTGPALYVGGRFSIAGDAVASNIAKWNGTSWSPLGGGVSGCNTGNCFFNGVYTLAVYNGELVAGGEFTSAGGVSVNNIARWNGLSWSPLGSGASNGVSSGRVYSLTVYGGELIVGGGFTSAGGLSANRIAKWDGNSWSLLGTASSNGVSGSNPHVYALTVYGGQLIAGGYFTSAGGVSAYYVARWNGTSWSPLSSNGSAYGTNGSVHAFAVYNGDLIAGGSFSRAGSATVLNVAKWNGSSWSGLGGGVSDVTYYGVTSMAVYNSELVVGGVFTVASGVDVNHVAKWNGSTWSRLGSEQSNGADGVVYDLVVYNNQLIVGGDFVKASGVSANHVARWDSNVWSALDSGATKGVTGTLRAVTVYNGELIAGGERFTSVGGVDVNGIAKWNGVSWSPLGTGVDNGVNGDVYALMVFNGELIAAGEFSSAGGVDANNIAKWDGISWSPLGDGASNGIDDPYGLVFALAIYDNELIVAGDFNSAGGISANYIAKWNGTSWSSLSSSGGNGLNSWVYTLAVFNNQLVVGGAFQAAGGISVHNIAQWDGSDWSPMAEDNDWDSWPHAMTVYGDELVVGGYILSEGGVLAGFASTWNGEFWQPLGVGYNDSVDVLTVYNDELIMGGYFTSVDGVSANSIARWRSGIWSPLGDGDANGVNNEVFALVEYNNEFVAAGAFTIAGNQASAGWARTAAPGPFATADFNRDCHVDAADLAIFEPCATGPAVPYSADGLPLACRLLVDTGGFLPADFDYDSDVDQADFAVFQRCYSGENVPADPNCGN